MRSPQALPHAKVNCPPQSLRKRVQDSPKKKVHERIAPSRGGSGGVARYGVIRKELYRGETDEIEDRSLLDIHSIYACTVAYPTCLPLCSTMLPFPECIVPCVSCGVRCDDISCLPPTFLVHFPPLHGYVYSCVSCDQHGILVRER